MSVGATSTRPSGPLRSLLPPPVSPGWDLRMDRIPDVGEDTESILRELGREQSAIDRLVADGVVGLPPRREPDPATE